MQQNTLVFGLKFIAIEIIGNILYFPIWWYTRGVLRMGKFCLNALLYIERLFGLTIKLKNIYRPMFQDYTFMGFVLGIVIRIVVLLFTGSLFVISLVVMTASFIAYLILPGLVIGQIIYQLT